MTTPRGLLRLLMLALVLLGLAGASVADEPHYKVIVNPANPSNSVGREFLRDAYLKKATEWHGETLRPIDLSPKHLERELFTKEVLRKSSSQLRTYWSQQVFSGKGVPPPESESPESVIEYVLANRGAVGYVPISADVGKAKVISVR